MHSSDGDTCHGKQSYRSQGLAVRALAHLRTERRAKRRRLVVYRCLHCEGEVWHLGHAIDSTQRRRVVERRAKERPWCWSVEMI